MSAPYYSDDHVTLHHGDCLDVLRTLPDASVDAVVTDPPYGISFMGKAWDQPGEFGSQRKNGQPAVHARGAGRDRAVVGDTGAMDAGRYDLSPSAMRNFQRWCEAWAAECLRVLKPGGHLVAFGGSRTWHRLAAGVEDAGFEIRDSIAWLYGSGFPKSMNVAKAISTGGRPEDIRRAAMGEDYAPSGRGRVNYDHGGGSAMNGSSADVPLTSDAEPWRGWGTALKPSFEPIVVGRKPLAGTVAANVLAHGTGALNIDATRVPMSADDAAAINAKHAGMDVEDYDRAPGVALNLSAKPIALRAAHAHDLGRWPANVVLDGTQAAELGEDARFFPTFRYEAKAPTSERPRVDGVAHPTVKPLDLMRWLVRLITPPGGVVLEPFAGSGSTAEACVVEGFRCIAIEREADYLPLITSRLTKPIEMVLDFGVSA